MSWDRLLHPDQIEAEEPKEKRTNLDTPVAADAEDEVMADAEPTKETAVPAEKDVVFPGMVYLEQCSQQAFNTLAAYGTQVFPPRMPGQANYLRPLRGMPLGNNTFCSEPRKKTKEPHQGINILEWVKKALEGSKVDTLQQDTENFSSPALRLPQA
ncbi:Protein of unknown function [Pyronema omphalodes CBS 100304]|uniref:Uncharacterized protein n=1 Tax=Pyronema omphalodes (strain CBS 100304) TaxID=1076935 RepID=U4KYJ4_PYROM|nr:Protein of unknown function [Pyronema omphalodes CBS 100304]